MKYLLPVVVMLAGLFSALHSGAEFEVRLTGLGISLFALIYLAIQSSQHPK